MIKINLLPKSIYEKIALRNTAILFGVLFVAIVAGCLTFTMMKRQQVAAMESAGTQAASVQAEIQQKKTEADGVRTSIGPIDAKLKFIKDVHEYNAKWPALCEEIAKWTYEKVELSSLQFTNGGQGVSMQMRVKTLDDLGRYLINMYQATKLFSSVTISGLPGYPAQAGQGLQAGSSLGGEMGLDMSSGGGAGLQAIEAGVVSKPSGGWFTVQVDCVLRTPILAPSAGGAAATTQPGMAPGAVPAPPTTAPTSSMPMPGPPTGDSRPMPGPPGGM